MSEHHFNWHGRTDDEDGVAGFRWHQQVQHITTKAIHLQPGVAILGYPSDLGVIANKGRDGARFGPNAIRSALAPLPIHNPLNLYDAGDIDPPTSVASSQSDYAERAKTLLEQGHFVVGLGGGHDIALGSYQAVTRANLNKGKNVGIINFDAHFDLRKPSRGASSGTPFYQAYQACEDTDDTFHYFCLGASKAANTKALFDMAEMTGTRYLLDTEFSFHNARALLAAELIKLDVLYVTVCLDSFSADRAPGVSAPSALGIDVNETIRVLKWLHQYCVDNKVAWQLLDIAEMNPDYDIDQRTAKLAARLIFEVVNCL